MQNLTDIFDTLYNNESLDENNDNLLAVLNQWGCSCLYKELIAHEITLQRLKYLTEADLDILFKDRSLGSKIEFRHHLGQWQLENNTPSTSYVSTRAKNYTTLWLNNQTGISSSASSASSNDKPTTTETFRSSKFSKWHVIHVFNKHKKLNDAARKVLVDAIVAWYIERKIKISRDYFEKVSIVIEKQFNDDKGLKQNPFGRLYDKYYNNTKRLRKIGLIEKKIVNKSSVTIPILTDEIESEECENLAACLRVNSEPWTDVKTHWMNTFKKRHREILLNFSLLFKHLQGFNLIDLDFYEIYEEKSYGLIRKWPNYKNKIINILNAKIKDKENLKLLKYLNTINSSEAISDTIIALLIHALLPPSVKYISKENNKKIILKSTIKDSQDSMFLHVKTLNDFDNRVEHLKNHLTERNESLHSSKIFLIRMLLVEVFRQILVIYM
ncbi:hypothetical protein RN001_002173 [Aquatica leii]|uniref:Uncharacterized protein n=1 Tax=Aquatica leii TaxID=1421715 RepID=A0AAN7SJZ9_9COLE|nr:hypothetical protein RN001_002173 [Aquatica leii]